MERDFELTKQEIAVEGGLAVMPYRALARGFLTGKYRPGGAAVKSPRAAAARITSTSLAGQVLRALDEVSREHDAPVASVALRGCGNRRWWRRWPARGRNST